MDIYNDVYRMLPKDTKTILDVGAGWGVLGVCKTPWFPPGQVQIDAIEIFPAYAKRLKSRGYRRVYRDDALKVLVWLKSKSYDVIVCTETLEHLPQDKIGQVIRQCERVGRRVIFSSRNKFFRNDLEHLPGMEGNPYQQHISHVPVQVMRRRGYTCRGQGRIFSIGVGLFKRVFARFFQGWVGYKDCP